MLTEKEHFPYDVLPAHYEERSGEKEVCIDGIMRLHVISFLDLTSFGRHPSIGISFAPLFDRKDYNRDLNSDRPVGISRSCPSLDRTVTGLVGGYGVQWMSGVRPSPVKRGSTGAAMGSNPSS